MSQPEQDSRQIGEKASFENSSAIKWPDPDDTTDSQQIAKEATSENSTPSVRPNTEVESDQPGPPWNPLNLVVLAADGEDAHLIQEIKAELGGDLSDDDVQATLNFFGWVAVFDDEQSDEDDAEDYFLVN